MLMKNPVTPLEIDPGTVRIVAQRLNHYATPVGEAINFYKYTASTIILSTCDALSLRNDKQGFLC